MKQAVRIPDLTSCDKWMWRQSAKRCLGCGWLFSVFAEGEDRMFCHGCESRRKQ